MDISPWDKINSHSSKSFLCTSSTAHLFPKQNHCCFFLVKLCLTFMALWNITIPLNYLLRMNFCGSGIAGIGLNCFQYETLDWSLCSSAMMSTCNCLWILNHSLHQNRSAFCRYLRAKRNGNEDWAYLMTPLLHFLLILNLTGLI